MCVCWPNNDCDGLPDQVTFSSCKIISLMLDMVNMDWQM